MVPLDADDVAVEATFEVEEQAWKAVQARFADAGVEGGMSFTAAVPQTASLSGRPAQVTLAADAATWSDEQRDEARALLDEVLPTESARFLQFSALADVATVFLILAGDVTIGMQQRLAAQRDELRAEMLAATRQGWELIVGGLVCSAVGTALGMAA